MKEKGDPVQKTYGAVPRRAAAAMMPYRKQTKDQHPPDWDAFY